MNYEEKYKNALERAKELCDVADSFTITIHDICTIFPELQEQESEDEKIRKKLICFVENWKNFRPNSPFDDYAVYTSDSGECDKILAWLEKQGQEPKKVSIWKHWENGIAGNGEGRQVYLIRTGNTYNLSSCLSFECDYIEISELDNLMLDKQEEPEDKGEISDGYHTFNELYEYRKLYNAAFFNLLPKELVHKSKRHHDGEECFGGGWFIVMANLPTGQISNHYELKDWDLFQIPEKEVADVWDGHTPQEAADRLHEYLLREKGEKNELKKVEQGNHPRIVMADFTGGEGKSIS